MKTLLSVGLALAVFTLPGCLVGGPHGGVVAVIPFGHVHSAYCGHYQAENVWYYHEGHHHCVGCGHQSVRGVWRVR